MTGPKALTPQERTGILAAAIGRDLTYVNLAVDQERERMRSFGYPVEYIEFGVALATNPPKTAGVVRNTVEAVTGRPARTFAAWAEANAEHFRN